MSRTRLVASYAPHHPGNRGRDHQSRHRETFSIGDFARRILGLMECDKPILHDAAHDRAGKSEVMKLVFNNRKAARLMQWRPATLLDDGLRQMIDFIAVSLGLYTPNHYTV